MKISIGNNSIGSRILPIFGNIKFLILFILFFILFPSSNVFADQASLYLSPASETYQVGSEFSVFVKLGSGGNPVNAAEGTVSFDPKQLSVSSISKSGSVFSLWTNEPAFSNSQGSISFGGGSPSAFNGSAGTIMKIVFRAKTVGQARVSFASGSVLAADGRGTNVLGDMAGGIYDLKSAAIVQPIEPEPEEPAFQEGSPDAPVIISKTHPDPEKWYNDPNAGFSWQVPDDITALRLSVGKNPYASPNVFYASPISEKELEGMDEGVWYFSAQFKNNIGWGKIGHFKFQIDLKPPEPFEVEVKEGARTSNSQPTAVFEAIDRLSGIDRYEIKIDQGSSAVTKDKEFKLPPQASGKHRIEVAAFDNAGNSTLARAEVEIFSLEAPVITDYPKELYPGTPLLVKGSALPGATVNVFLQGKTGEAIGRSEADKDGFWSYIDLSIEEEGIYKIFAQTIDGNGGKSQPSPKVTVLVTKPVFIRIGDLSITCFAMILLVLILLVFGILIMAIAWRRRKKRIRREVSEAEEALIKAFRALKEETEEQVARLDGQKGLNPVEQEIADNLKEALKISEGYVREELRDIDDELK